ncbi:MAG: hypothetical protein HS117_09815 [Verrucomicrobiaceae bacterium]|jgi:hypothetical protein|nr:hypothetical protein [Verrucomicrobiaceae bacterium]
MMTPRVNQPASPRHGWVSPVLWSLGFVACLVAACVFSPDLREIVFEGLGYMWAFFTTPFILEASVFFIGICVVLIINNLRMEREGDGWVEMEVKNDTPGEKEAAGQAE